MLITVLVKFIFVSICQYIAIYIYAYVHIIKCLIHYIYILYADVSNNVGVFHKYIGDFPFRKAFLQRIVLPIQLFKKMVLLT